MASSLDGAAMEKDSETRSISAGLEAAFIGAISWFGLRRRKYSHLMTWGQFAGAAGVLFRHPVRLGLAT